MSPTTSDGRAHVALSGVAFRIGSVDLSAYPDDGDGPVHAVHL